MMSCTLNGAVKVGSTPEREICVLTTAVGVTFLPQVPLSWLKVMSPKTWTIIDRYGLQSNIVTNW